MLESYNAQNNPRDCGIARNFDSGSWIEQHYWDPPLERKLVGMKSLISNEHLILNGVNTKILPVGWCKRFELVS